MAGLDPLRTAGRLFAGESAWEAAIPLGLATLAWEGLREMWGRPTAARPATPLELAVLLGAAVALTAWAVARQVYLAGPRRPTTHLLWALPVALGAPWALGELVRSRFAGICTDELGGRLVTLVGAGAPACQGAGIPGNPYLTGWIVLPAWDGHTPWLLWPWLAVCGVAGALALRDRRLFRTKVPLNLGAALRLAPTVGSAGVLPAPPKDGTVVACANPTLWGELCGQLYDAARAPEPGAWCARCQQGFTPHERTLTFTVVSLLTDEIDVLNGLERLDAVAWDIGTPRPPDARLSGQERWAVVGEVNLPDVISVAQALALVYDRLGELVKDRAEEARAAAALADRRGSRICAWFWFGFAPDRLTWARPTRQVAFGVGAARLRDLVGDTGEALVLQLDIGLLPVEVRAAWRRTYADPARADDVQNTCYDLWLPVGPPSGADGRWVDRVEGAALRAWLATASRHRPGTRGVVDPLPYLARDAERTGPLDLVRLPVGPDDEVIWPPGAGSSLAEWDWLEPEQIQLLRTDALVQVAT